MPEKHICEECGARMQSRRILAGDSSYEEWYCKAFEEEKSRDEDKTLDPEKSKHPISLALWRLNKRKHPGRGHA